MGWSIGYDDNWNRDIGYGVPAYCDHPQCREEIDRGLSYVCGGEPYGGEHGCGLYFCGKHLGYAARRHGQLCYRCLASKPPYKRIKPEHPRWVEHVSTDESWAEWRTKYPQKLHALIGKVGS
jgi:hypothetical protein